MGDDMAKWDIPTPAEREIIRERGMDPDHCAVSRPGDDLLVILNWLDHSVADRETYVFLPPKNEIHNRL